MTILAKDDGRSLAFGSKMPDVVTALFSHAPRAWRTTAFAAGLASLFSSSVAFTADLSKLPPPATRKVEFAKDIQPLLADRCYSCHGEKKQESGLRLDVKDTALKGGEHGAPLVVGKSAQSLIVQVVAGLHDELAKMPKKGEPLTAGQIGLLRAWIDQGADWPASLAQASATAKPHWAFQPVAHPVPPKVKSQRQVRNEIDQFVLARLEKEGLKLSPEADRATLIRRVTLDLTGLPPTPEEVDAFLADRSTSAYQKVVERLLKSPSYGEKWARHWLDAARYADSNGFEKDRTRSIWPWRDWVINALNRDMPFDQFTIEQLAGDLLPNATVDQRVATGFLRNSMQNQEGGIEPEKFRVESMIDRLDAVGRTWLGLTVACAQCHSHKYDPISQKEYYQFYAFLNQDVEPKLEVLSKETETKRDEIRAKARALEDKLMTETPDLATRMAKWEAGAARLEGHWQVLDAKEWHITPMKFEKQEDLSLLGGGDIYNNGVLRVWVDTQLTNITGFRLEALNHPNLPFGGPGIDGNGQFELCEFSVEATPLRELVGTNVGATNFTATTNMVKFIRAEADAEAPGWEITKAIDGDKENGGWATDFTYGRRNQERRAVFEAEKPLGFEGGTRLLLTVHCKPKESKLSNFLIGHVRLSLTTDVAPLHVDPFTPAQRKLLAVPVAQRTPAQQHELFNVWRQHEDSLAGANKQWDELWRDWPAADSTTLVMQKRSVPRVTRIFRRGDYLKPTTEVEAGTPAVLHPLASGSPRDRLGLARWIVDTRNPLTPRVIVNRVWQQYFGAGLVLTPEDFGTRAEPPSHPELLDWLAGEFMRRGWSQKELHRLIVMSATYRQSSRVTPELLAKDPYNRLLARGPRFRLDAEEIQDVALKAAGLLSPKIGGPSVFPPLPDGVMQMSYGPIPWNVSEGEDRYRRAMYTFWKRSVPYPAMVTFDAPTAEQSCVRRARSDTPLQALITLNETSFNNAARWLAWRTLSVGGADDKQRVVYAFRQCLARKPERREMETLLKLLDSAKTEFAAKPKEAGLFAFADPKNPAPLPPGVELPQLAAWSTVTRAILNLDETVTKE